MKVVIWILFVLLVVAAIWRWSPRPEKTPEPGAWTVERRIAQFGDKAKTRWKPFFDGAGVAYPPAEVALLAFKNERVLEVQARGPSGEYRLVRSIPILGASGVAGPKLREGDRQVPEGLYRIESLNPNSRFHVSLRLNYPSAFDWEMAVADGREEPGSDIMIHGGSASIGCLAVGDEAAEDLFALAAAVGLERIDLVLAPADFRTQAMDDVPAGAPAWTGGLYERIRKALQRYPVRP